MNKELNFGKLFRKFRLKAEFSSLHEFGQALADEGFIYEDSSLSRWQNGSRIPTDRKLLTTIIKILINKNGISSLREANILLESADQGYLTENEIQNISKRFLTFPSSPQFANKMVDFMADIGKSKRLYRTGWVREKIKDPESVAEHSFRVSVLSMVLADQLGLDKEKLIKMALVHDLGEVITGDLVFSRGEFIDIKKKNEKEEKEEEGIKKIFKTVGQEKEYVKIFSEMRERTSEEAKIFWEIDKLEMAMQALEYEKEQNKKLDEFFVNADLTINTPHIKKILRRILKRKNYLRHPTPLKNFDFKDKKIYTLSL